MLRKILKKDASGFTLIEVLVASFLVLVVLVSILATLVTARYSATISKHKAQAVSMLQQRMEELKSQGYDTLLTVSKTTPIVKEANLTLDGDVETRPDLLCTRLTTITDNSPADDVLEMRVELFWNEKTITGTINVSEEVYTLLADVGG